MNRRFVWVAGALAFLGGAGASCFGSVTAYTTGNATTTSSGFSDVSGLSVTLAANTTYYVEGHFLASIPSGTGGFQYVWTGTASAGAIVYTTTTGSSLTNGMFFVDTGSNTNFLSAVFTNYETALNTWMMIRPTVGGTLKVRFRSNSGQTLTLQQGSGFRVRTVAPTYDSGDDNLNDDFSTESTLQAPSQASVLQLLYSVGLRPCGHVLCSPTPTATPTATATATATATPTATPTGTPSPTPTPPVEASDVVHETNKLWVTFLAMCTTFIGLRLVKP